MLDQLCSAVAVNGSYYLLIISHVNILWLSVQDWGDGVQYTKH